MNFTTPTLILLAASLGALTAMAQEPAAAPLWEVQARLNGGKNPKIAGWIREVFEKEDVGTLKGENAVVRFDGIENKETPEEDWVAEVRGVEGLPEFLAKLQKDGVKDENGRVVSKTEGGVTVTQEANGRLLLKKAEGEVALWSPESGVLRLAYPPVNATREVKAAVLPADAWLAGSVDLTKIETAELDSTLLKMVEGVTFTASSPGQGATLNLTVKLANAEAAAEVTGLVKQLHEELAKANEKSPQPLPLEIESKGNGISLTIKLSDGDLDELMKEVKAGLQEQVKTESEQAREKEFEKQTGSEF